MSKLISSQTTLLPGPATEHLDRNRVTLGRPPAPTLVPEPTVAEMAGNFGKAIAGWAAAGFPVVPQAVYDARAAACGACELWDADARLGLGKCKAPGCGCSSFKRWLQTERCKHPSGSKWPE